MANDPKHILLDTHVALWILTDDKRLPISFRKKLKSADVFWIFHQISIWEVQIKFDLGKLKLPEAPKKFLQKALDDTGFISKTIENEAIFLLSKLPNAHRDPFDRMLIAHSILNNWPIATADPLFEKYPVKIFEM